MNTTLSHLQRAGFRLLCVLMAGLTTGCGTIKPSRTWRDASSQISAKQTLILEGWGKPETPNDIDPEIAPGYLINLRCLADNKLNGDFRVEFSGELRLPYDVSVNTTGMTLVQLKKKLTEVYRPYFKTLSEIDVRLKERRYWVDVRGLVEKPGHYLIEPEASLDYVIGLAGGTSKIDPPQYVRLKKGQKSFVFDLTQYYSQGEEHPQILGWLGGEVLFFQKERTGLSGERSISSPSRRSIFLMGEVRKPGEYTATPGLDFLDTLTLAGGFTERADLDDIQIIRRMDGRNRVYNFSWDDFRHAPAPTHGDIIFVRANNQPKSERRTLLFMTIISALAGIATSAVIVLSFNHNGGHI